MGFLPDRRTLSALRAVGDGTYEALLEEGDHPLYKKCHNYAEHSVCNWMIPVDDSGSFCLACDLNRTIPDLSEDANRIHWGRLEAAKRRLVVSLLRLGLPVISKKKDPERGLAFDFLADPNFEFAEGERVLTGHNNGVITINIAEADDLVREKMRLNMREVYRTVLGHFRHESGHYYWDLLVRDDPGIDSVRAVFGDDRSDYGEALQAHYQSGPPDHWETHYVTPYAAAHPWEDWAETWAHYLHIVETLDTAASNGIEIRATNQRHFIESPFGRTDFEKIRQDWHGLRFVLNSLNRSMGMPDPYPFTLSDAVTEKLAFIHQWIGKRSSASLPKQDRQHSSY